MSDEIEFKRLLKFYNETRKSNHSCAHLWMKKVYIFEHNKMKQAFDKKGKKIGNIMELFHGTRSSNLLSIMAKGMIIPPSSASHCTGRLYADGLYFSDQSTKSLNYSYGYWGGGSRDNNCFMLLVDVAMGRYYVPKGGFHSLPKGYDSCFAKASQSGVFNNEMIVYKTYQASPKYLIEFGNK